MSKNDNLLTEGQVRQFMKLANLAPITPGFILGLNETGAEDTGASKGDELKHSGKGRGEKKGDEAYVNEESTEEKAASVRQGIKDVNKTTRAAATADSSAEHARSASASDARRAATMAAYEPSAVSDETAQSALAGKSKKESHGRAGVRLREDSEYDEHELENAEDDLEHADDLDIDAEEDLGDVGLDMAPDEGGREISVDDFLVALEQALESVLGDEVEVEQDEEGEEDEEIELPLEGGEELDMDVEEELPLQEMINKITKRVAKRIVREALQNKK
jgi:hypothetical protein